MCSPMLPLPERSLEPTSTPRHIHISPNLLLALSMVLDLFFLSLDTAIWSTVLMLLHLRVPLDKGVINDIKVQLELE